MHIVTCQTPVDDVVNNSTYTSILFSFTAGNVSGHCRTTHLYIFVRVVFACIVLASKCYLFWMKTILFILRSAVNPLVCFVGIIQWVFCFDLAPCILYLLYKKKKTLLQTKILYINIRSCWPCCYLPDMVTLQCNSQSVSCIGCPYFMSGLFLIT